MVRLKLVTDPLTGLLDIYTLTGVHIYSVAPELSEQVTAVLEAISRFTDLVVYDAATSIIYAGGCVTPEAIETNEEAT